MPDSAEYLPPGALQDVQNAAWRAHVAGSIETALKTALSASAVVRFLASGSLPLSEGKTPA